MTQQEAEQQQVRRRRGMGPEGGEGDGAAAPAPDDSDVAAIAAAASRNAPARVRRQQPASQRQPGRRRSPVSRLGSFNSLPDYLRDNEYITHWYRTDKSVLSCVRSLFGLHNETGNIWTHLLGERVSNTRPTCGGCCRLFARSYIRRVYLCE